MALARTLAAALLPPTERRSAPTPQEAAKPSAPAERVDRVELSPEAEAAATASETSEDAELTEDAEVAETDQRELDELRDRDQEVRRHEQAHKAAAGTLGGAISFEYTTGPDGKRYVTGGEVPIDNGPVEGDPEATIRKMQQVKRAALAPAEPSSADHQIAAGASREEQEARAELRAERQGGEDGAQPSDGAHHVEEAPHVESAQPGTHVDVRV